MLIRPGDDDLLLIIDVQNDFCPGGALAVADGDAVVPVINRLAERFDHIALTQDWHPPGHSSFATSHPGANPFDSIAMPYGQQTLWPDHCRQGTAGAAFHPKLEIDRAELIIRKGFRPEIDSYSAFFENDRRTPTGLAGYLRDRGLRRVFVAGLATDFGISGYGRGLNSVGAYSNTPDGKVIMAAYVDAFNKLVPQMQARTPPPRVASKRKR